MAQGVWTYKLLIDPLTRSIRRTIIQLIPPRARVLDIACGTGSLVFALSPHVGQITGVDLDEDKIQWANRSARQRRLHNVNFLSLDATKLTDHFVDPFDYVTISLALHQFPASIRIEVARQAAQLGKHLIIADYSSPLPGNPAGLLAGAIERLAGKEHFGAFRHFQAEGGIPGIYQQLGLHPKQALKTGNGVFSVNLL